MTPHRVSNRALYRPIDWDAPPALRALGEAGRKLGPPLAF